MTISRWRSCASQLFAPLLVISTQSSPSLATKERPAPARRTNWSRAKTCRRRRSRWRSGCSPTAWERPSPATHWSAARSSRRWRAGAVAMALRRRRRVLGGDATAGGEREQNEEAGRLQQTGRKASLRSLGGIVSRNESGSRTLDQSRVTHSTARIISTAYSGDQATIKGEVVDQMSHAVTAPVADRQSHSRISRRRERASGGLPISGVAPSKMRTGSCTPSRRCSESGLFFRRRSNRSHPPRWSTCRQPGRY